MCRANGRRCPGCADYAANAKSNGRRRLNRLAQRRLVDHLTELGMTQTAAALQKSPPSVLADFLAGAGIDPAVLGDVPIPRALAGSPSASELVAMAKDELTRLATATAASKSLSVAEHRLHEVEANVAAAQTELAGADLALDHAYAAHRAGTGSREEWKAAEQVRTAALDRVQRAIAADPVARDALDLARYRVATEDRPAAERDAYLAQLTPTEVEAVIRARARAVAAEIATSDPIGLDERDLSVNVPGKVAVATGGSTVRLNGQILDGGTAIVYRGPGEYDIVQQAGDAYHVVGFGDTAAEAFGRAHRIPRFTGLEQPGPDRSELEHAVWRMKCVVAQQVAREAAHGSLTDREDQQRFLEHTAAKAAEDLADQYAGGVVRGEVYQGIRRHRQTQRLQAAATAGEHARAAALAAGADSTAAEHAYQRAYRGALGRRTAAGAIIPHFDHADVPASIGEAGHNALCRSGIRASGVESAADYPVIAARGGDLAAWGFTDPQNPDQLKTSDIKTLTAVNAAFVHDALDEYERSALRDYTGGTYHTINAALTGRDPAPTAMTKASVAQLHSAFDKLEDTNPNAEPMTIIRGASIPSAWTGSPADYAEKVFQPGSRIQTGKLTSGSTDHNTALSFIGHPPCVMVIRTRHGIPVESITKSKGEHEVIVPPGVELRCVRFDPVGLNGHPTAYLVGEDLVAESQHAAGPVP